jgi:two-component system sensor histidine kinase/response regulator
MNKTETTEFNILIVDDNPKNLQVLGKTLEQENYRVEFAIDGKTALEWVENQDFDLILLDIIMPGMDGFEVCEKIRSDPKKKNIPIIFLTSETNKESILKGFELGARDYVTKPFNTKELLARVKTHLELEYSKEQLRLLNRSLEEKVAARTGELSETIEKLNLAKNKLLQLDRIKSEFLHIISHEIRTSLNGILGPVRLLKDQVDPDDLRGLINILDISVSRLERFSYDALLITELRTDKDRISKRRISLNDVIDSAIMDVNGLLKENSIRIKTEEISEPVFISGEFELLKTCFVKILENAIKYSEKKGQIELKVTQSNPYVTCEVVDYGKGFSQEAKSKLFELFSSGEKFIDQNLGLGMALVKLIMDAHSGKIEIENNEQGGASVKLTFNMA